MITGLELATRIARINYGGHQEPEKLVIAELNKALLEAYKEGMTEAAEIPVKYAVDTNRTPVDGMRYLIEDGRGEEDQVRRTYKQAILKARDSKTSL